MLRCRIPAGELTSAQLRGLADLSDSWGNGKAAITTRSNLQIREIAPKNIVNVLTRLASLGLTSIPLSVLQNTIMLEMAVLNAILSMSPDTFLIVLCMSFSNSPSKGSFESFPVTRENTRSLRREK